MKSLSQVSEISISNIKKDWELKLVFSPFYPRKSINLKICDIFPILNLNKEKNRNIEKIPTLGTNFIFRLFKNRISEILNDYAGRFPGTIKKGGL